MFYLLKVVHSSIKRRLQRASCHVDPLVISFAFESQPFESCETIHVTDVSDIIHFILHSQVYYIILYGTFGFCLLKLAKHRISTCSCSSHLQYVCLLVLNLKTPIHAGLNFLYYAQNQTVETSAKSVVV